MDSPRIRILVTAFAAVPGSSPHGAALLAMTAAVRGELDLVTIKTEALSHVEKIGDARMFRVPVGDAGPLEQRIMFDRAIARQLEAERYDVVHVRGPFEGLAAAARKAALDFQLVYEVATFPDEALGAEVETRWAEAHARCVEQADLILVPTEASRRALSELERPERIVVLHPGVDVGSFDWKPPPRTSTPRLLYLGSFSADRDLGTLLGAIKRVSQTREVRALLAGETDATRRERLRTMVHSFELEDIVEVRGEPHPRALPKIIAGADLCIAPASEGPRFESLGDLPQPLLEYLACHRPVIAAGVPGVSEVMRDEHEGLLYPPGDEGALADAILQLLRDTQLRDRTVDAGYRRVRELFSSGARRRRIAEIYERLVPGSQGVDPWEESFENEHTGSSALAESLSDLMNGPGTGEHRVPGDTGEATGRHGSIDHVGDEMEPDRHRDDGHGSDLHEPEGHGSDLHVVDTGMLGPLETQPGTTLAPSMPAKVDTEPGALVAEATRPGDTNPGTAAT